MKFGRAEVMKFGRAEMMMVTTTFQSEMCELETLDETYFPYVYLVCVLLLSGYDTIPM